MTVEFGPYRATSSRESCLVFPPVSSYLPSSCDGTRRIDLLEGSVTGRETRLDVGHVESSVDEQKELVSGEPTAIEEEPGVAAWKREKRKVDQPVGRRNIQMWIWRIVSSSRPSFIFCLSVVSSSLAPLQRCMRLLPDSRLSVPTTIPFSPRLYRFDRETTGFLLFPRRVPL